MFPSLSCHRYLFFISIALCCFQAAAKPIKIGELEFTECDLSYQHLARTVQCAELPVPLEHNVEADSNKTQGEDITLFVVRLPALSESIGTSPLLMLAGGPGQASSQVYLFHDYVFNALHQSHDIYLIDQRGTGGSSALECQSLSKPVISQHNNQAHQENRIQACLAELNKAHNVDQYLHYFSTRNTVMDMEYVRKKLGVSSWHIFGASYGTRLALDYMTAYPDVIQSAVLDGVVPLDVPLGPTMALHSDSALNALIDRCQKNIACAKQFPALRKGMLALVEKLKQKAITVNFYDMSEGESHTMLFTSQHLATVIRMSLYSDEHMALLPMLLQQAYQKNNYTLLAKQFRLIEKQLHGSISMPLYHTIVCYEDIALLTDSQIVELSESLSSTFMGDDIVRESLQVCKAWPVKSQKMHAAMTGSKIDSKEIRYSDIPTLLLSGSEDPVTPPENAEHVLKDLNKGMHIVAPGQGHGVASIACMPSIINDFIKHGTVDNEDLSCVELLSPAPFFINLNAPSP